MNSNVVFNKKQNLSLTKSRKGGIIILACVKCGGIAQMARAPGSYPVGRRFDSSSRYHILMKAFCGRLAQLGEHLPYKQRVTGSSPVAPTSAVR